MHKLTLTLAAVTLLAANANAVLYNYEGFDYALSSSLNGQNGGFGWAGAWAQETAGNDLILASNVPTLATNLTYTGLRVNKSGGGPGTGTQYARSLNTLNFDDGDTLWFSFSIQGSFDSGFQNGIEFWSGGNQVLTIGNDPTKTSPDRNQFAIVDDNNTRYQQSAVGISTSSTFGQVVIGKIDFAPGDDSISFYYGNFVPLNESGLGTNITTVFENQTIANISSIDQIKIDINNSAQGFVDEIRLGATYEAVRIGIPEPSTYAAMGGAAALLIGLLRRRK